jgi:hypothetical protein
VDYTYSKSPRKWNILYGILALVLIPLYIWDVYSNTFDLYRFFGYVAIPMIIMMSIIRTINRYYRKVSTDCVSLSESSISLNRHGIITQITWEEVTKVEWRGQGADKYSALYIKATNKEIGIGDHIDGLSEIIPLIKHKVGDRFNTFNIPWELKNPKTQ